MAIDRESLHEAIHEIAGVDGITMDEATLVEDVLLLARSFPDELDFRLAVANTTRALSNLALGKVDTARLKYDLGGYRSFHYQHRVGQGQRADCRIVFKESGDGIAILGIGHRDIPSDIYARLSRRA